jgi:hypothetical protein
MPKLAAFLGLMLVLPVLFAGCASEAYQKACSSCPFDENGKTDQSCSDGYKASGTACVSTTYPLMAAKYAKGECPDVDSCASELSSCVAQYSSGNDRADCQEGSVGVCYAAADECTRQAAAKCGEIKNPCGAPSLMILLVLAGTAFFSRKR